ncbi:MAG: isoamylase early set domain-containing protein [Candidatus Omnitrophica bacterium]|nr:isoamylase early set domain-containing protein [Candidatus Omnitrophota bacterium]
METKQLLKRKSSNGTSHKIEFEYFAPQAKSVSLVGTFNNWNEKACPLRKDKGGRWRVTLPLQPGRYEYRFLVDGTWECDPEPKECVPNPFGSWNCVVSVSRGLKI